MSLFCPRSAFLTIFMAMPIILMLAIYIFDTANNT